MRIALALIALLTLSCGVVGPSFVGDLEPGFFKGAWVRVTEVPVGQGFYTKDILTYRIGLDPTIIPDTVPSYESPISFIIQYPRGGTDNWYLSLPGTNQMTLEVIYESTKLLTGEKSSVTFRRPLDANNEVIADTLCVTIGTETFGLKRG